MAMRLHEMLQLHRNAFSPEQYRKLRAEARKLWQSETKGPLTTDMMLRDIKERAEKAIAGGYDLIQYEVATDGFVVAGKVIYETVILVRALGEVGSRNWFYHWGSELVLPLGAEHTLPLKVIGRKDLDHGRRFKYIRGMAEPEARIPLEARMSKVVTDILFEGLVKYGIPFAGLQIGIDVNPDPSYRSHKLEGECRAYCCEYEAVLKPSPAIAAADRANKEERERERFTTKMIPRIETWMRWKISRRDILFERVLSQQSTEAAHAATAG